MMTLGHFRYKPGTRLRTNDYGIPIMVLELAAGMIRDDCFMDSSGGKQTVAVVRLDTGQCEFYPSYMEVREDG